MKKQLNLIEDSLCDQDDTPIQQSHTTKQLISTDFLNVIVYEGFQIDIIMLLERRNIFQSHFVLTVGASILKPAIRTVTRSSWPILPRSKLRCHAHCLKENICVARILELNMYIDTPGIASMIVPPRNKHLSLHFAILCI